jgi:hypothetical protein
MQSKRITDEQVATCVSIIKSIPKIHDGFIGWKSHAKQVAAVVACALNTDSPKLSARIIAADVGLSQTALYYFLNGKDTGGGRWQELRDEVKKFGLECYSDKSPREVSITERVERIEANADSINAVQARTEAPAPATKPIVLATTNKGEVIVADPPAQVTAPPVMAAKPGEFATKENGTRCVLDTKTKDILVITTRRIEFGTPAWCEKMVEINSKPKAQ